jgi:hypothetical protein
MMLQHLFPCFNCYIFHGATYASQCFNVLLANVADVEFRCCRHVMLGVGGGRRALDVGFADIKF